MCVLVHRPKDYCDVAWYTIFIIPINTLIQYNIYGRGIWDPQQ